MKIIAMAAGRERELTASPLEEEGRWRVVIDGVPRLVDARRVAPGTWSLLMGDEAVTADVDPGRDGELLVEVRGVTIGVKPLDPRAKLLERAGVGRATGPAGPTPVLAPMPGKVVKVLVKQGDAVTAGQGLVIVEAMKMENELRAPRAGTVAAVRAREGQPVEGQETLVTID
jgi:biotin carboxyl carrier protein